MSNRLMTVRAMLLLILLFAASAPGGTNQNDDEVEESGEDMLDFEDFQEIDPDSMERVSSSAAKHQLGVVESPSAVTIIGREEIEHTHCSDVVCLLRQVPEVDARELSPMFAAVGARALTGMLGDRTLVLVDGRELTVELFGFTLWHAFPVHLEDIQRIEVIRGPGSALYGANAHSMVVSVTTRSSSDRRVEWFLGAGELDRSTVNLRTGGEWNRWGLSLSGGLETAAPWQLPTLRDQEVGRAQLDLKYFDGSSVSSLQAGVQRADGRIFSPFGSGWLDGGYQAHVLLSHDRDMLKATVWFMEAGGNFPMGFPVTYGDVNLGALPDQLQFVNRSLDAEAQLNWSPWKGNLLITGANYRWNFVASPSCDHVEINQHRIGVFLQDEQRIANRMILTGGFRLDYNSISPFAFSPRLAWVWRFGESSYLRAAFGQAFRKPSFLNSSVHLSEVYPAPAFPELKDFFLRNVGNKQLGNESITALEVGYRGMWLADTLYLDADVFYNRYRDTINLQVEMAVDQFGLPNLSRSAVAYQNRGSEVDSIGASVSASYQVTRNLTLDANYTYRYSWYVSQGSDIGKELEGTRLAWEPAHLVNLSLRYFAGHGIWMGASAHAFSEIRDVVQSGMFNLRPLETPASWFLGAFVSWRMLDDPFWFEIGVRGQNILHMPFHDLPGILNPDPDIGQIGGDQMGRRILFFLRGGL